MYRKGGNLYEVQSEKATKRTVEAQELTGEALHYLLKQKGCNETQITSAMSTIEHWEWVTQIRVETE